MPCACARSRQPPAPSAPLPGHACMQGVQGACDHAGYRMCPVLARGSCQTLYANAALGSAMGDIQVTRVCAGFLAGLTACPLDEKRDVGLLTACARCKVWVHQRLCVNDVYGSVSFVFPIHSGCLFSRLCCAPGYL